MAAKDADQRRLVAKIAAGDRWGSPDGGARRDLAASQLETHIRQLVSVAPPLTQEQRNRLAVLLQGGRAER